MTEKKSITMSIPLWLPYTRAPHAARFTAAVKNYHASSEALAVQIKAELLRKYRHLPATERVIKPPFRVALAVFLAPMKGKRKPTDALFGLRLSATGGDYDNYVKALVDAMVYRDLTIGDGPACFRGILPDRPSGVYALPSWTPTPFAIFEIREVDEIPAEADDDNATLIAAAYGIGE